ncbi:MAG: endonuclease NucS [bacterium]|nr:endonuclease NucS [bacterium]
MKSYYRIMLGKKSAHAEAAHKGDFIGADFGHYVDLSDKLTDDWKKFNEYFIPEFLYEHPGKSKVAAGLAGGFLYTIAKKIQIGDIVLCPNGKGAYYVGEVTGDYQFSEENVLPHRRGVKWYPRTIQRSEMSEALQNSTGSIGTVSNVTKYAAEIEIQIGGERPAMIVSTDETIEDPTAFAMEKHLEDFLVQNWTSTELGKRYDIYQEDGELVGQQYPSDTGPIDILAISKDKKELLVVELKKGRATDVVLGQIQRYMGYVKDELAEQSQSVKGVIIALDSDTRLKRALSVAQHIDFFSYSVSFKLIQHK